MDYSITQEEKGSKKLRIGLNLKAKVLKICKSAKKKRVCISKGALLAFVISWVNKLWWHISKNIMWRWLRPDSGEHFVFGKPPRTSRRFRNDYSYQQSLIKWPEMPFKMSYLGADHVRKIKCIHNICTKKLINWALGHLKCQTSLLLLLFNHKGSLAFAFTVCWNLSSLRNKPQSTFPSSVHFLLNGFCHLHEFVLKVGMEAVAVFSFCYTFSSFCSFPSSLPFLIWKGSRGENFLLR